MSCFVYEIFIAIAMKIGVFQPGLCEKHKKKPETFHDKLGNFKFQRGDCKVTNKPLPGDKVPKEIKNAHFGC